MEEVLAVDFDDLPIKTVEKLSAHKEGILHRAFSVFLCHETNILLQKRALNKYHCPGLWTNTCCSHPGMDEDVVSAGMRRLYEELGIKVDSLTEIGEFIYYYRFENGLCEYEYDHILFGNYDGKIFPNYKEVCSVRWVDLDDLKKDVQINPSIYTPWFLTALKKVDAYIGKGK